MIWICAVASAIVGYVFCRFARMPKWQGDHPQFRFGLATSATTHREELWMLGHKKAAPVMWVFTVMMGLNAVGCLVAPMYWGLAKANEVMFYITFGLSFGLLHLGAFVAHYPCFKIVAKEVEAEKRRKKAAEDAAKALKTQAESASYATTSGATRATIEGAA